MIHNGDVFLTRLERGFFGAFRVLKTGGRFDFSPHEFFLISLTPYADPVKPDINDPLLRESLCEKRFYFRGIPFIEIYQGKIIEKSFEYLGNIPLSKEESDLNFEIGDGTDGGYPLAGAIQKDFGFNAFLEWRWEHERDEMLREEQEQEEQNAAAAKQDSCAPMNLAEGLISEAFRYQDEKSDKFWRVEYAGNMLAVNYGKTGTTGKYQIKEFDTKTECESETKKLIASKRKKGYAPYLEFDPDKHFYFDDEEFGPCPLTSHPRFRMHFTDDLYYDCGDEEAPFGSDEGSDTLAMISEDFHKSKSFDFTNFPKKLVEVYWDMDYLPATDISRNSVDRLVKTNEMDLIQSDMVTYAAAFAQIKITGRLDAKLKAMALNAMKRMEIVAEIKDWNTTGKPSEILSRMIRDLEQFPAE